MKVAEESGQIVQIAAIGAEECELTTRQERPKKPVMMFSARWAMKRAIKTFGCQQLAYKKRNSKGPAKTKCQLQ
jgi:hypothetical protein